MRHDPLYTLLYVLVFVVVIVLILWIAGVIIR